MKEILTGNRKLIVVLLSLITLIVLSFTSTDILAAGGAIAVVTSPFYGFNFGEHWARAKGSK